MKRRQIARSLVFMAIPYYLELPLTLPFSLYSQFVIEEEFGFNKQTLSLYFTDLLKQV